MEGAALSGDPIYKLTIADGSGHAICARIVYVIVKNRTKRTTTDSPTTHDSQTGTKVWDKIGNALEKYDGIETDVNKNYNNVYVQDCSGWNRKIDPNGHSYQYDPESVAYYLRHMTLDQSMTKGM